MKNRIISSISLAICTFSAVAITSVGEVDNWFRLCMPWIALFTIFAIIGIVSANITSIRRYTYPTYVCLLAWGNEHNIIKSKFAKHSNYIYRKHNRSYSKLYEITQDLYDRVMFAEV